MNGIYTKLEFNYIREKLASYTHTEIAHNRAINLEMLEKEELIEELDELNEAIIFASKYKPLAIGNHRNIMKELALLLKEGSASLEFFVSVSDLLGNIIDIQKYMPSEDCFKTISNYVSSLKPLTSLKSKIDSVISKDMTIYDNASSHLSSIRYQIRKEESGQGKILSSLMNKYRNYLNDERMAMKDDGLTLPVKITYKNRVEGIVIDYSTSRNTAFIMPLEIILSNNKIASLKEEEEQEIIRILKELARHASKDIDDIRRNLFTISHLDYLFAKANYAAEIKGEIAVISEDEEFILYDARHPLIDQSKVIANSFILDEQKIMLITGPNAGGKTVALKTAGLLVLMHQCGLAIPVSENSKIPYFENIFVDIGDDQSLSDNLSTFTAHMRALKKAVNGVNSASLVLIDELGTGTSPLDGEALGIGVLKYLHELEAYAILSSHYDGLKSFALENRYILNASMIFNEEKLIPTYKIRLGVAGKSYGLEVATREGINKTIIQYARDYIFEKKNSDKELALSELNSRLLEVDNLRKELEEQNENMRKIAESQKRELNAIKEEKRKLEETLEEQRLELLEKAKEEVEKMMEDFKNKKEHKLHEVIEMKKKIDDKLVQNEELEDEDIDISIFKVNDYVIHKESSQKGTIKAINKDSAVLILDSGLTLKVKLKTLRPATKIKKKHVETFTGYSRLNKSVSLEFNVIGLTVAEAIPAIAKYLDDARTVRFHQVRIIHGSGTGKLRSAVHEYLKKQSFVEEFRLGGMGEGSVGATVVKLK